MKVYFTEASYAERTTYKASWSGINSELPYLLLDVVKNEEFFSNLIFMKLFQGNV
jgi:hypothetical protein